MAALYRSAGCDFYALTDHWTFSGGGVEQGMLRLSGCEYNIGDMFRFPVHHIVGLGMHTMTDFPYKEQDSPQTLIQGIHRAGGIAILAHPAWSMMDPADLHAMDGIDAVEIYNTVSGLPDNSRPDSSQYVDIWASQGHCLPCVAADDFHGISPLDGPCAFTMFYAETLSRESVLQAISKGDCFASQGPEFYSITEHDGVIRAQFSTAQTALFSTNRVGGDGRRFTGPLTCAEYKIHPADRFVRLEIEDRDGRKAWTRPWPVHAGSVYAKGNPA